MIRKKLRIETYKHHLNFLKCNGAFDLSLRAITNDITANRTITPIENAPMYLFRKRKRLDRQRPI